MKTIPLLSAAAFLLGLHSLALADEIRAQPIGLLDKAGVANTEQSDFFTLRGLTKGQFVTKLFFTAKTKDLGAKGETRALFEQDLQTPNGNEFPAFHLINKKTSPLKQLAKYTVATDTKFDWFQKTGTSGDSRKTHYPRMFFHVPGKGIYSTEGGKAPILVRAENVKDPTTAISGYTIRLNDYRFDEFDADTQARLILGSKDASKGYEPFIYAGSGAAKVLKDIYTDKKIGSDPHQFATYGPQNSSQVTFFSAKSPADANSYQLWTMTQAAVGNKYLYDATLFTTAGSALVGEPQNLIANGYDLFFTAPTTVGGTPELWHYNGTTGYSCLTSGQGRDPQHLTFTTHVPTYSELAFTVLDAGVRRYARWSSFDNSVTILGVATGFSDPFNITDAGQEFYFGAFYVGSSYLLKHTTSDNLLTAIVSADAAPGGAINYVYNIGEICAVSSDGTAGTVYFVASAYVDGAYRDNILFRIAANQGPAFAQVVRTPADANHPLGQYVTNAKNLRSVIDAGSGVFRLYFSAPVNSTTNSQFIPVGSTITDFGTKPWVTEAP